MRIIEKMEANRMIIRKIRQLRLMWIVNSISNCVWSVVKKYSKLMNRHELDVVYSKKYCFQIQNRTIPTAKDVVEILIEEFHPNSVVDVGCGTAVYLKEFQKKGVKVKGYEGSRNAIDNTVIANNMIDGHDFRKKLVSNEKYDLALSFEVGEHIEKKYSPVFVKNIAKLSNSVVFSAAPPGQGGRGHINEQPMAFWIKLFNKNRFKFMEKKTIKLRKKLKGRQCVWWLPKNVLVFQRMSKNS